MTCVCLHLARLFEVADGKLAYKFAAKYYKNEIGDRVYEYPVTMEVNVMKANELIKEWSLSKYAHVLISEEGFDDIEYWKTLSDTELRAMGFKPGHARKFMIKAAEL